MAMRTKRWGMSKLSVLGLAIRPRPGGCIFAFLMLLGSSVLLEPGVSIVATLQPETVLL